MYYAEIDGGAGSARDGVLSWSSNALWLAGAERNDAADGIVRRNADGYAIPGHDLDSEAAHPAAELGEHFVAGVALHTVKPAAVHCHYRTLHVDKIVLAQTASIPFPSDNYCATTQVHYATGACLNRPATRASSNCAWRVDALRFAATDSTVRVPSPRFPPV